MKMSSVPYEIYCKAGENLAKHWDNPPHQPHFKDERSLKFFGWNAHTAQWDYHSGSVRDRVAIPERLINLFHAMAGPHYVAIIKAWEIKNDHG